MATTLKEQNQEYIPKSFEYPNCLLCKSDKRKNHEKFGPDHRYSYVQCKSCKLVYLHPRPTYDEDFLEIAYSGYGLEDYHVVNKGKISESEAATVQSHEDLIKSFELHKSFLE